MKELTANEVEMVSGGLTPLTDEQMSQVYIPNTFNYFNQMVMENIQFWNSVSQAVY